MYSSWDMVHNRETDRWTDRKSDKERWVPHLMKIVQEQWLQLKMRFLLGYNMEIIIYWGEN